MISAVGAVDATAPSSKFFLTKFIRFGQIWLDLGKKLRRNLIKI